MIRELFLEDLSLWACIWQSTVFAMIGLVGSFLLRRRPARASQVLFLAMVAAVVVPAMSVLVKHFELGVFTAEPIALRPEVPNKAIVAGYESLPAVPRAEIGHEVRMGAGGATSIKLSPKAAGIAWRTIMLYGWMIATLVLLGRLFVAFVSGVWLLRGAQSRGCEQIQRAADSARAKLGITKGLHVRSSKDVRSPVIWCWSPTAVLLVPGDLDYRVDWAGVICHELAHWRRWDHISGLIAELIVCILPWNPLLWWSKKRMVRLSEQACDDWVVAGGRPCEDYAQSLLNFKPQKQAAFVPAVVHSRRGLAGRVRRILKDSCGNPRAGVVWVLVVSLVAACLAVGVACAQTRPAEPAAATAQEKTTATPTAKDKAAATAALFQAIENRNTAQVKSAVAQGADLEAKNKDGCTPLYAAVANPGGNRAIKLLLEAGANPNARDPRGQIPLHAAARRNTSLVRLLVSAGCDVNARDKNGMSPAVIAFELRKTDMFDLMVAHGATFSTDLMSAYKGDLSRVQSLIENGKAQETVEQGLTLLHAAAAGGHTAIVELLLTNGLYVGSQTQARYTALHYAAAGNHREMAELLLARGADVNAEPSNGWSYTTPSYLLPDVHPEPANQTPLHWAIREGHKDMIEWLLARGANPNADGGDYHPLGSPLNWAIWGEDVETAVLLVSHGADIHYKSSNYPYTPLHDAVWDGERAMVEAFVTKTGDTIAAKWAPLHAAVASGNRQAVEDLLAKGADVNAKGEGGYARGEGGLSAIHVAAGKGHKDIAELLITRGADVNEKAKFDTWHHGGWTPLYFAICNHHSDVAELLLAKGADVNVKDGRNLMPLHLALYKGLTDLAELLVARDADVNARGTWGNTPLQIAAKKGYTDITRMLLDKGANPNVKENERGKTPLHAAAKEGHKAVAELLRKHGAKESDEVSEISTKPLHQAAALGDIEQVKSLIASGADVNAKDEKGHTPLHAAANRGHADVAELLITNGADVNGKNIVGNTPLHAAAVIGNKAVVEFLIAKGADLHAKNKLGRTPLHWAARRGCREVAELLISKGADVNAKDKQGTIPMSLAKQRGHSEIVELLRKHGVKD